MEICGDGFKQGLLGNWFYCDRPYGYPGLHDNSALHRYLDGPYRDAIPHRAEGRDCRQIETEEDT